MSTYRIIPNEDGTLTMSDDLQFTPIGKVDNIKFGHNVTLGKNVSIGPNVTIGDNVYIDDHAIIGANTNIGKDCYIGKYSIITDSTIGNYVIIDNHCGLYTVNIADSVTLNTRCLIMNHSTVGIGSWIKEGCQIDKYCNIPACIALPPNTQISIGSHIYLYSWKNPIRSMFVFKYGEQVMISADYNIVIANLYEDLDKNIVQKVIRTIK